MKDIINLQFETLKTFKYYDDKYARKMNKGNLQDFFLMLLDYEKQLMEKQTESIDRMLTKKHNITDEQNEQWEKITEELERDGVI